MGKRVVLIVFQLVLFSVVAFAYEYWYMDMYVEGSQQRVYFFRNLKTMEEAMGIPPTVPGGPDFYQWWESGFAGRGSVPEYTKRIFAQMQQEGFGAAFVYWRYQRGEHWYLLFLRQNGRGYCDFYITNNPIKF
jgi:hypothetical protein